jgi:hypothetical protein
MFLHTAARSLCSDSATRYLKERNIIKAAIKQMIINITSLLRMILVNSFCDNPTEISLNILDAIKINTSS